MPAALAVTSLPGASSATNAPARVLIADDSAVVRGLVSRWLTEAGFEVVATCSNGRIALDALNKHDPDVVLLDIDMPELDGTSALPLMLARVPGLQVVMMSTLTQRNADISLKCLALGAVDYLPKPESSRGVTTSDAFRTDLVERVRLFGGKRHRRVSSPAPASHGSAPAATPAPATSRLSSPVTLRPKPRTVVTPRCLLIGSSTGGPRAVGDVLERIGAQTLRNVPTLIVQHMPPVFTAVFAEHLGARVGLPAAEGKDGERLQPGRIYVAPGGRHMGLAKGEPVIRLDDGPVVNFCRPAVDVLFFDAAAVFGAATLSVILTGMGADGTPGARALVEAGGMMFAQDEATSTVWGMPGSVAKAGLCHGVLPLPEIGPALKAHLTGQAR
ncbi:protein-glutamate methylesterase/protein-glutamine glutaminase [Methylobacterium brachythecii]|uniref:Protein-glutamate methylesterase/protein-glutamine glutaminase n=1 Tax=Methylobacterium brachythecii TaxID=1176177 RepID=A0A7W6AJS8_9HYPH|nr:chemotaxis response regulator protein-glutamate methylesterase [Methylobacterium brachythecii]MBB3902459.1 two-component system chemotaxis response regulator CheB [Methylobacterium brachythecii]GLS42307.1 chemotaxis response regulator protein-glutamate methylesterase of group 2 operon [Methylobacterium brachythecii]